MHVTIHMTNGCNMKCDYCYAPPLLDNKMTEETMSRCIDFISKNYPVNTGIIFFGGEPLLQKDLMFYAMDYAKFVNEKNGAYFHYKLTSNGVLLDEEFIQKANKYNLEIGLSIDGIKEAHNKHRKFKNGDGTFDIVSEKLDLLFKYQPYSKVLMTISPDTVQYYAQSFEYLLSKHCKYIIVSLDYSADWTDDDIKLLEIQYKKIAKLYEQYTTKEHKFYFSPFDMKFTYHIKKEYSECYHCHLAQKQISVAFNGDIYPCVQFVQDGISNKHYKIGDVFDGFDEERRAAMYKISKEQNPECLKCSLNDRCNNKCSCLNWQLTGEINELSPKICETERILIPIVDKLGERLYKKQVPMFIQKHYNTVYPIISWIEDHH